MAYQGAPETGLNVFSHSLDMVAQHPGIVAREQGIDGLCQTCRECPVVSSCGGGLYTHRYRAGRGFGNPSVYCADLLSLISHVGRHQAEPCAAGPERPAHTISTADFTALGALGDAAAITSLSQVQRSLVRALLAAVYQEATTSPAVAAAVKAQLQAAWSVLATVDREQPEALAVLLGHPYLRAWAVRCLAQLRAGAARPDATLLGHLGAVAAAAAARGGLGAVVTVPVLGSAVHLPTLGRLALGPEPGVRQAADHAETALVSVISNAVIIEVGDSCWTFSLPGLLARPGPTGSGFAGHERRPAQIPAATCAVLLAPPAGRWSRTRSVPPGPIRSQARRLSQAELAGWQHDFQLAWQLIEAECAAYAPGLAAGLTTLTPLLASPGGPPVSAAARQAFGAVAASPPAVRPPWPGCSSRNSSGPNWARFSTSSICTTGPTTVRFRRPGVRGRSSSTGCCRVPARTWRAPIWAAWAGRVRAARRGLRGADSRNGGRRPARRSMSCWAGRADPAWGAVRPRDAPSAARWPADIGARG